MTGMPSADRVTPRVLASEGKEYLGSRERGNERGGGRREAEYGGTA